MASKSSATGFLLLDITGFNKAIATAKRALAGLAAAFAAFKTVQFWKDGIADAINFGNEVYHASQRIGAMDPGKLLIAQKALENAGLGAEEARTQIDQLVTSGRSLGTLFHGAGDYAKALQNATASYGSQANVLSKSAEKLSKVFEIIQSVGSKLQTFFLAMTSKFVAPLQVALEYLNTLDLAGMGEAFGKSISDAAELLMGLIANGDVWNMMRDGAVWAFKEAMNYLTGALKFAADNTQVWFHNALADAIMSAMQAFAKVVAAIFSSSFWDKLTIGFVTVATNFGKAFKNALLSGLQAMQDWFATSKVAQAMFPGASQLAQMSPRIDGGKEKYDEVSFGMGDIGRVILELITKKGPADPFKKGTTFDASKEEARIGEMYENALGKVSEILGKQDNKKLKIMPEGLGSQDPYKVIASSMAKVGGGGGYIQTSMSIEARNQMKMIRGQEMAIDIAKQQLKATEKIGADKMKK